MVRYRDQQGWHHCGWEERVRAPWFGLGKPTDAKAEAWRRKMNESMRAGGVNDHLAQAYGFVPHVSAVEVCRNGGYAYAGAPGRVVVARAKAPTFEVG